MIDFKKTEPYYHIEFIENLFMERNHLNVCGWIIRDGQGNEKARFKFKKDAEELCGFLNWEFDQQPEQRGI